MTADTNTHCLMMDYDNFNVMHTKEAQQIIFEEIATIGEYLRSHPDWIKANNWIKEAKEDQVFTLPGDNAVHKVFQGMFSGTRSTDLIN